MSRIEAPKIVAAVGIADVCALVVLDVMGYSMWSECLAISKKIYDPLNGHQCIVFWLTNQHLSLFRNWYFRVSLFSEQLTSGHQVTSPMHLLSDQIFVLCGCCRLFREPTVSIIDRGLSGGGDQQSGCGRY